MDSWPAPNVHHDNAGVAALILGVAGLLTSVMCIGAGFGIAAVVCGLVSRAHARRHAQNTSGKAIAGIVLGVISTILGIGVFALFVWMENQYQNSGECWPFKTHAGCY